MPGLSTSPSTVQAIFSLDIVTAFLAFLLFILAAAIVITRISNGRIRSFSRKRQSGEGGPLKTTLSTHLFLVPSVFCLAVAYTAQSAVVALQLNSNTPASVTSTFSYPYAGAGPSGYPTSNRNSILAFTQALATVFSTFFLTGAVWLHSDNLTSNGTNASSPKTISKLWNTFILTLILVFGLAAWGRGISVRGSGGGGALSFPSTISNDFITRVLYIVFRCVVVFSSTSVSIEVLRNYSNLKANGIPQVSHIAYLPKYTSS